jgi:hypothetical protein
MAAALLALRSCTSTVYHAVVAPQTSHYLACLNSFGWTPGDPHGRAVRPCRAAAGDSRFRREPSTISRLTPPPHDPQSIDFAFMNMARRRLWRERVSVILAGVVVIAMVVTFYRILSS